MILLFLVAADVKRLNLLEVNCLELLTYDKFRD